MCFIIHKYDRWKTYNNEYYMFYRDWEDSIERHYVNDINGVPDSERKYYHKISEVRQQRECSVCGKIQDRRA